MDGDISIIIPVLNERTQVAEAVRQALAAGPREVLVADGGSSDGTPQIVSRLPCRLLASPPGRAVQQNHAARHAAGGVLLFLHADCRLPPDGLAQVAAALADPAVVAGGFCQRIDAPGRLYRWLERGNACRVRRFGLVYGDQGIFVRREQFQAAGGFPEIALMEDVRLLRRLRRQGRIALAPGPLVVSARRWQRHGVLRQTARNWALLALERLGVPPDRLAALYRRHDR